MGSKESTAKTAGGAATSAKGPQRAAKPSARAGKPSARAGQSSPLAGTAGQPGKPVHASQTGKSTQPGKPGEQSGAQLAKRPPMLLVAAAALALEALALLVVTVLDVIDITSGQSYQAANGFALVILQLIMIVGLGMLASGALKLRPWTRTPAVMVQVLTGVVAVILLQAGRPEWGVPTAVLAVAGLVGLLAPASLKALARPRPED